MVGFKIGYSQGKSYIILELFTIGGGIVAYEDRIFFFDVDDFMHFRHTDFVPTAV